jgi:hypothetical protein
MQFYGQECFSLKSGYIFNMLIGFSLESIAAQYRFIFTSELIILKIVVLYLKIKSRSMIEV